MNNTPNKIEAEINHRMDWMFTMMNFNKIDVGNIFDVINYFDEYYHEIDSVVFMIPMIRRVFENEEVELDIYCDHGHSYPVIYIRQIVYRNDITRKLNMLDSILYNTYTTNLHITTDFGIPKE